MREDQACFDERLPELFFDSRQWRRVAGVVLKAVVVLAQVGELEGDEASGVFGGVERAVAANLLVRFLEGCDGVAWEWLGGSLLDDYGTVRYLLRRFKL